MAFDSGIMQQPVASYGPAHALTDAASIVTNVTLGRRFHVTITASRTLAHPTGDKRDGEFRVWEVTASGGPHNLTLASGAGGFAPTDAVASPVVIAAGKTLVLQAYYSAALDRWVPLSDGVTL